MGDTTCATCGNRISERSAYDHCLRCGTPIHRSTDSVQETTTTDVALTSAPTFDGTCRKCGNKISTASVFDRCLKCGEPIPTNALGSAAAALREATGHALRAKRAIDRQRAEVAARQERERTLKLLQRKVKLNYMGGHPDIPKHGAIEVGRTNVGRAASSREALVFYKGSRALTIVPLQSITGVRFGREFRRSAGGALVGYVLLGALGAVIGGRRQQDNTLGIQFDKNGVSVEILFEKCLPEDYSVLVYLTTTPSVDSSSAPPVEQLDVNATTPLQAIHPSPSGIAQPADELKKCPDCAEMVRAEARVCRFCRHEFEAAPE